MPVEVLDMTGRPKAYGISDESLVKAVNFWLGAGVSRKDIAGRLTDQFGGIMTWGGIKKRLQRAGYLYQETGGWRKS